MKSIDINEIPEPKPPETPTADEMKEKLKAEAKAKAGTLKQYPTIKPELNMYSIEETKDAVKAICAIGNGVAAALADDGKITIGDFPKFIGPLMKLPAAITGIGEVPKELNDLTAEEKDEIIQIVKDELEVELKAEEITTRILNIIYEIKSFIDFL
jgi:hypothetical protein